MDKEHGRGTRIVPRCRLTPFIDAIRPIETRRRGGAISIDEHDHRAGLPGLVLLLDGFVSMSAPQLIFLKNNRGLSRLRNTLSVLVVFHHPTHCTRDSSMDYSDHHLHTLPGCYY
ncbi:hypothetical protein RB195_000373 [Necator americanus]|uniref:Uncharacterized protein n=1 Tax=Necator americanus TaxID=51031 RepID=A0ABR1D9H3_NECAM